MRTSVDRSSANASANPARAQRAGRAGANTAAPGAPAHVMLLAQPPADLLALQRLVARRSSAPGMGDSGAADDSGVHAAARHGIRGPSGQLPHLDVIQRSFGKHDVSGVAAHTDQAATQGARAMNAVAFTTGNHVAFAGSPSLHTAAHEAAHAVQQRAGVQLAGGVGAAGDRYERHADAVADLVVKGQSAEALLDEHAGPAAPAKVQRRCLECERVQRKCAECKEEEEKAAVQARRAGDAVQRETPTDGPAPDKLCEIKAGAPPLVTTSGNVALPEGTSVHVTGRLITDRDHVTWAPIEVESATDKALVNRHGSIQSHSLVKCVDAPPGASKAERPKAPSPAPAAAAPGGDKPAANGGDKGGPDAQTIALTQAIGEAITQKRFEFVFTELDMRDMAPMLQTLDRLTMSELESLLANLKPEHLTNRFRERLHAAITVAYLGNGGKAAGSEGGASADPTPIVREIALINQPVQTKAILDYLKAHSGHPDAKNLLDTLAPAKDDEAAGKGEKGPDAAVLEAFRRKVRTHAIAVLDGNRAVLDAEEAKYADTRDENAAWQTLRTTIKPLFAADRKLQAAIEHYEAKYEQKREAIELIQGSPGAAGARGASGESAEDRAKRYREEHPGEGGAGGAFNASRGGGGAGGGDEGEPEAAAVVRELEEEGERWRSLADSASATRARLHAQYPILAADGLFDEGGGGAEGAGAVDPESNDALFKKLQTTTFAVIREAIATTRKRVEEDKLPLEHLGPVLRAVRAEMHLDEPGNEASKKVVDDWLAQQKGVDELIQVAVAGVTIVLGIAAVLTGGAAAVILGLVGSAVGVAGSAYNAWQANKLDDAALASLVGEHLVDRPEEVRAAYYMALIDLVLAGVDFAIAVKSAAGVARKTLANRAAAKAGEGAGERALEREGGAPRAGERAEKPGQAEGPKKPVEGEGKLGSAAAERQAAERGVLDEAIAVERTESGGLIEITKDGQVRVCNSPCVRCRERFAGPLGRNKDLEARLTRIEQDAAEAARLQKDGATRAAGVQKAKEVAAEARKLEDKLLAATTPEDLAARFESAKLHPTDSMRPKGTEILEEDLAKLKKEQERVAALKGKAGDSYEAYEEFAEAEHGYKQKLEAVERELALAERFPSPAERELYRGKSEQLIQEMQERMTRWNKGESPNVEGSVRRHAQDHYFRGTSPPYDYALYLEEADEARKKVDKTWRNKAPNIKSQGGAGNREIEVGAGILVLDDNGKIVIYAKKGLY